MSKTAPFTIRWYVPERVIFIHYDGDLATEDFQTFSDTFIQMMDASSATMIHIIGDASKIGKISANPLQIRGALGYLKHPKLGWINLYGSNRLIQFLASLVFQSMKVRVRFHADLAAAHTFLQDVDDHLHFEEVAPPPQAARV
jgi:hypothetical protein